MFFVYVLHSQTNGRLYIGQTSDLERRIDEHNQGLSQYTKGRGPWTLAYHEAHTTRADAMKREKFLKSGQGREWLKMRLKEGQEPPQID